MMKRKVKLRITTSSRQVIRVFGQSLRARCPICEREVEMLTRAQSAEALEIDGQTFDSLLAAGRLHTIQTVSGSLRVCQDSLFLI
jgi:hypothetical protein